MSLLLPLILVATMFATSESEGDAARHLKAHHSKVGREVWTIKPAKPRSKAGKLFLDQKEGEG